MSRGLRSQIERQIQKAIAEGQLSGPSGEGKPLPDRSGEAFTDMATRVATRIMAEGGAAPEEFKLKEALLAARRSYDATAPEAERRLAQALIAELELRYNMAVEARRAFMKP
ncbi:DnaJ family domain-containing protein [Ovoidimarina sediminis]|uniref:DnaJ family domain-containing protein n=1 Tax=Ovoidimarina sediminis TaxID=3079856 RepID=UPI00290BFD0A|nr:DnaJ family domain-containing protein [Rhodophyticola sp. MJ-SS7]MDU8943828.1 DUF1992 domain-containing protein [Rhodophyticola sp. MJ-SS7]